MTTPNVYELFKDEIDAMVIAAADPAAKVVGDLQRAVKRAQMVHDGELAPVAQRVFGRPETDAS